ncbi:CBS domain-containing protein [Streptomyces sp. WAC 00631]|uniref:CBS domain-containing protein n=1 Tax=unclassified Streptomyces TaxID=2593676 RepID=UPI000F78443A|nr:MULTISPECIES: CBS domain-containing protein [unclassified Streptomyces]MCC5033869.1 CBS domain-containing protein [Streptomyces sp. WAC 00631]MCC9742741.1 CBS domain-containing protein [Streptomyces sp. MNU89]
MKHRKVGTAMTIDVVRAVATTPFKDIVTWLDEHGISGMPVVDDDEKVIGVVSVSDLMSSRAGRDGAGGRETGPGAGPEAGTGGLRLPRLGHTARRAAGEDGRAPTAGELMTSPAVTVRAVTSIAHAARTMARHQVERLPVVDEEDRLVGIVTRRDLLQIFLRPDADIRREIIDEVLVDALWLPPHAIGVTVVGGVVVLEGCLERRSEVPIAEHMAGQVDGVVSVVSHLTHRYDDSKIRPVEPALHGLADGWLRRF